MSNWYRIGIDKWVSALWVERLDTQPVPEVLAVPPFSQRDPRWANIRLGTSGTTIGWNGCLISCIAMDLQFNGFDYTPATLNTYLTNNNGYDKGNLLWWGRVPHLEIATWIDCLKTPAPLSRIDAELALGRPCVVWVDFIPSTNPIDDHYVLIIGKRGADDYWMLDPWSLDPKPASFRDEYGNPVRFVFRIVSYKRKQA